MSFDKLEQNIYDLIIEQQLKLGYDRDRVRLYYPLSSLNRFLGLELSIEDMRSRLMQFALEARERLGVIDISNNGDRFCISIPPEGSEYIHNNCSGTQFLAEFIAQIAKHECKIEDILEIFKKYSDKVHFEQVNNGEFDYLIYFENGVPDSYRYCITDEGCHLIYHRYTLEDYIDFGF